MKTGVRLSYLDRANDIRMLHTCAILGFTYESCDRCTVVSEFFAENLEGDSAMALMLSPVHCRRTTLTNLTLYSIPGYLGADQALMRHAGESNRNRFTWIG